MSRVYLGGTCNGSKWRDILIPKLNVSYFNPVVENWNDEARTREEKEKEEAVYHLFVITPEMVGVYSIAELIDSTNKSPKLTVFCILREFGGSRFSDKEWKSLMAVKSLAVKNGAISCEDLQEVATYLNK